MTLSNRGHAQKSNQDLIVFKVFKQTNERTILINFGIHSDMQHFLLKATFTLWESSPEFCRNLTIVLNDLITYILGIRIFIHKNLIFIQF